MKKIWYSAGSFVIILLLLLYTHPKEGGIPVQQYLDLSLLNTGSLAELGMGRFQVIYLLFHLSLDTMITLFIISRNYEANREFRGLIVYRYPSKNKYLNAVMKNGAKASVFIAANMALLWPVALGVIDVSAFEQGISVETAGAYLAFILRVYFFCNFLALLSALFLFYCQTSVVSVMLLLISAIVLTADVFVDEIDMVTYSFQMSPNLWGMALLMAFYGGIWGVFRKNIGGMEF